MEAFTESFEHQDEESAKNQTRKSYYQVLIQGMSDIFRAFGGY